MAGIEPTCSKSQEFILLWQGLTLAQQKFAAARLSVNSDADAARQAGVPISTARQWRSKADVDKVIRMMTQDAMTTAMAMLTANLNKALMVLVEGLDSQDARLRHDTASQIVDRVLGKAVARVAPVMPNGIEPYETTLDGKQADAMVARIEELVRLARERRAKAEQAIEASVKVLPGQPTGNGTLGKEAP
jgi:hypothetical protein